MSIRQESPDACAEGFLGYAPNSLRYDYYDNSIYEVHNVISRLIPVGDKVLEIGCGTGILGDVLRKKGLSCYEGIEPSRERANLAAEKGHRIHNIYLDKDNCDDLGVFGTIVLADVIEHLENPKDLLDLSKLLMQQSSRLIVSVPNVAHWSIRTQICLGRFNYTETGILDATHLRWFTCKSLEKYLQNCGFAIANKSYTCGYMLPCYVRARKCLRSILSTFKQQELLAKFVNRWPELFACQLVYTCYLKDPET